MGSRPSQFKKGGGGFLNGVDGVIVDYTLSTEFKGSKGNKASKKAGSGVRPIYALLSVRVDGADKVETTNLTAAFDDAFEVSGDGKSLDPLTDSASISGNLDWGRFIGSMCDHGFDEAELPEDAFNWEAILGRRCRFVQVKDEKATERRGQRVDPKTGRKYDRTALEVAEVYPADAKAGAKSSKAGKASKKGDDLTEIADSTLKALLEANDGELLRSKIAVKATMALKAHPSREAVKKLLLTDDYIQGAVERGLVDYDEDSQMIAAA